MNPDPLETALSRTHDVLREGIAGGLHTGAQLHVSRHGEILHSGAIGQRRPGEAMTADTLLLWRSAGKPLTALAVARAWENGRLDLDASVARYLPEFAVFGKEAVTPRHLLTHSAGFHAADPLPESLSWEATLAAICATPMEPGWRLGEDAAYQTQSGWFILAEILRRLDGRDFAALLRDEILLPLGMEDSWVGMPAREYERYGARIGTTFQTFPGAPAPHPFWDTLEACTSSRPGSNARGPAAELGRFYEALLSGGGGVVRPETVREFTRRQRAGKYDQTFRHIVDFGLGFVVNSNRYGASTVPYGYGPHASEDAFGHSGAQSSCAFADPAHGLVVAWVCNGLPGEPRHQRRQRALNTAIYEDLGLAG